MVFRRNQNQRPSQNKKEIDKSKITCYNCNKVGHFKTHRPLNKKDPKRFPFKKKSMMESWDDCEKSNFEEENEEANVCLKTSYGIE